LTFGDAPRRTRRRLIAVLGTSGAGKTVYLGMLTDLLSRRDDALQILASGAYSVALQQHAMTALARRQFPPQTPNSSDGWNWLHCEISGLPRRRAIDLVMPDLSGDAFFDVKQNGNSPTFVHPFLAKCSGALLLVDTGRVERGEREQEFQAMKLVSLLCELGGSAKRGWRRRPLAIVFSKADRSEACAADPSSYAKQRLPGLWRLGSERLMEHCYFAASVVGSYGEAIHNGQRIAVPLRVEPRGIVPPFEWLVRALK
jgi:hypothetical protein